MSKHRTEQAVVYRIYTENKINMRDVERFIRKYFDGFTVFFTNGHWKGTKEDSIVIEIIADYTDKHSVLSLAGDIKVLNEQETVLVTTATVLINEIN